MNSTNLYAYKTEGYFENIRYELIEQVPIGPNSVLEVGCGQGSTGAVLKAEGRAKWVAGVELFEIAAQRAREVLDDVIVGNIEQIELPFSRNQFNVIILGDILEHLVDPWNQLRRLLTYLAPNGIVVASLPNVRNWRVFFPLFLFGKWEYQDFGIMDRTHLRFFTKSGMIKFFEESGLKIKKIIPIGRRSKAIARLPICFLSEFIAPQYLIVCTHKETGDE